MHPRSRALPKHTIVELTATDEQQAAPGGEVNSVLYIGFFEVEQGGIIVAAEGVNIAGTDIGHIAGFSGIHEPNHLNVLVKANEPFISEYMRHTDDRTMVSLDFSLEQRVEFE